MATIRIAVGQAAAVSGEIPQNVVTAVRLVEQAGDHGAAILLLPELFLCGYDLDAIARDPERFTIQADSELLAPLRRGVSPYQGQCGCWRLSACGTESDELGTCHW